MILCGRAEDKISAAEVLRGQCKGQVRPCRVGTKNPVETRVRPAGLRGRGLAGLGLAPSRADWGASSSGSEQQSLKYCVANNKAVCSPSKSLGKAENETVPSYTTIPIPSQESNLLFTMHLAGGCQRVARCFSQVVCR